MWSFFVLYTFPESELIIVLEKVGQIEKVKNKKNIFYIAGTLTSCFLACLLMTWPGGIIKENVQEAHAIDSVRTFEVYNEGQLIADYTGKFSIQQNEDRVIVIDCDTGDSFTLYGDVSVIIKTVF